LASNWLGGVRLPRAYGGAVAWQRLWCWAPDLAAVGLLLAALVVFQWPSVAGWGLYARSDTFAFFYPVFFLLHQSLQRGSLPLWTPELFGGFPLFAEGQVGALYPPGAVATLAARPESGFLGLRVFHVGVALLGMYAFLRALRIASAASAIGALVFGLGGFIVAQQHHGSLIAAAVWLPLVLALVELGLRRADWATDCCLALAGMLVGIQLLGSHIQPVLFSMALVGSYVIVRQCAMAWATSRGAQRWLGRLHAAARPALLGIWALIVVCGVGLGIGAVQLVPLVELARESWRASAWSYQDAIQYSFPPVNLVTLIFPYFFRSADGSHWSLWQYWEVVLFCGVAPLVLATVGLTSRRRGLACFFLLVAGVALVLSFGGYLPFGWYEQLWTVPGLQLQRAPARLTYLVTMCLAILAALGVDRLTRCRGSGPDRLRRELLWVQIGVISLLALVVGHLVVWRAWLHADPRWALVVLGEWYLGMPRDAGHALTAVQVLEGLDESLDLANPKTWLPLSILALLVVLLIAWREVPRLSRIWRAALVSLVAAELLVFAVDFHPVVEADRLHDLGPAGHFLAAHAGEWRVLADRTVTTVRPNQLLLVGVADAGGYSPLELDRHRWYGDAVATVQNSLLDLWNVRYLVVPTEVPNLPSYERVAYHPTRPLLIGGARSDNGKLALRIGGEPATEVRTILALVDGQTIRDGEVVGEWMLTDEHGVRHILTLRAGREVADWSAGQPGVRTLHRPVEVAARSSIADSATGRIAPRALSYAVGRLADRTTIAKAEYRHIHPIGKTILYGVALFDARTDRISQFFVPEKLLEVYRDSAVVIYENLAAYPRAWVAEEAIEVPPAEVLQRLGEGAFDGRRQVILEEAIDRHAIEAGDRAESTARVLESSALEVLVKASAPGGGYLVLADAYYPGWRAIVNGEIAPILRANAVSRAVRLPAGEHEVRFRFEPTSFRIGAFISAATLLMAFGLIGLSLWCGWVARRAPAEIRAEPTGAAGGRR
jgi:hypothetical protein